MDRSLEAGVSVAMSYVAIHSCGRIVAATVDRQEDAKTVAREVARWVRLGDKVNRMSVEKARRSDWCECWDSKKS